MIEINPFLASHLRWQIQTERDFQLSKAGICLINADLRRFPFNTTYDYIISSLPFTNFPPQMVQELLETIITHLKPGGIFSYIKYIFIGRVKYVFSASNTREKVRKNEEIIAKYTSQYQIKRQAVLANIPPTWVYHWRKMIQSE
jgi:phospholipid N-methyltransferase